MRKSIFVYVFLIYSTLTLAQNNLLDKRVSAEFKNIALHEAINELQNISNIPFAYNNNQPGMTDTITAYFKNKQLGDILQNLLIGKQLEVKTIGNQIILYPKKQTIENQEKSKNNKVEGKIIDSKTKEPLSMINVSIIGTTRGTITDENGNFIIAKLLSGNYSLLISSIGYQSKQFNNIEIFANHSLKMGNIYLDEGEITLDEVVITPGSFSIMGSQPLSSQTLDRENLKNMSFSEDITRAVSRLPGVSSNDFSSKFTVRGGETDEVLITLDGMELFDPFHQRDFAGGLFSIVDIEAVQGVDLLTGGFSAEFGKRQSGVFNMTSKSVTEKSNSSIGLSIMNARLYTEGTFANGDGSYLFSGRRGMLDQTFKLIDETENIPIYYDFLGKVEHKLSNKHRLSFHFLQATDKTEVRDVVEGDPDYDIHDTWYNNTYGWLTLTSIYNPQLFSRSIFYGGNITHHRHGSAYKVGLSDKVKFKLFDERELNFFGIKQDWNWMVSKDVSVKSGFDFRQLFSNYNYDLELTDVRVNANGEVSDYSESRYLNYKPNGYQIGAYFTSSFTVLPKLFIEPGLRFDLTSYTEESNWSPRVGVAYAISNRTFLRVAWGYYYQSQFIYNMEVNYGANDFRKSELSKHYVAGIEHTFNNGFNIRLEGYYKDISLPSVSYQNLRDQWEAFPEVRNDVVKLNISEARTKGIELFLKYDIGENISWWFSYAYSKSEENVESINFDGLLDHRTGWLPRANNQTHTIYADINYRLGKNWVFNLSWQYWNDWPLTIYDYDFVQTNNDELHFYPRHTSFRGETYPDYHRLDLRINYHFEIAIGRISTYLHIINLYDRENLRKYDLDVQNDAEELVPNNNDGYEYFRDDQNWFGITPVIGISWEF